MDRPCQPDRRLVGRTCRAHEPYLEQDQQSILEVMPANDDRKRTLAWGRAPGPVESICAPSRPPWPSSMAIAELAVKAGAHGNRATAVWNSNGALRLACYPVLCILVMASTRMPERLVRRLLGCHRGSIWRRDSSEALQRMSGVDRRRQRFQTSHAVLKVVRAAVGGLTLVQSIRDDRLKQRTALAAPRMPRGTSVELIELLECRGALALEDDGSKCVTQCSISSYRW